MSASSETARIKLLLPEIERLVPGFSAATQGATAAQIETLKTVASRPLPAAYLEFLALAGTSWGGGEPTIYDSRFAIDTVTEYWRNLEWNMPTRFVPFAKGEGGTGEDLFLDLEAAEGELALVRFAEPEGDDMPDEPFDVLDQSFTGALFVDAWSNLYWPEYAYQGRAGAEEELGRLDATETTLISRGWRKSPLSSRWWRAYDLDGVGLLTEEWRGKSSFAINVATKDAQVGSSVLADLARLFGLQILRG